jgi:hypothetical protein
MPQETLVHSCCSITDAKAASHVPPPVLLSAQSYGYERSVSILARALRPGTSKALELQQLRERHVEGKASEMAQLIAREAVEQFCDALCPPMRKQQTVLAAAKADDVKTESLQSITEITTPKISSSPQILEAYKKQRSN